MPVKAFNKRNKFKGLSHEHKFTCQMGQLVPFYLEDIVPGDTFKVNSDILTRITPLLAPIMHRVDVQTFYFFVPYRLLQDNFEEYITKGFQGTSIIPPPRITSPDVSADDAVGGWKVGSLADHLGFPTDVPRMSVSAYPFRAYAKIYNEYFRSEFLQPEISLSLDDGTDTETNTTLLNKCWEKDYFTAALPSQQLGNPATIPLGTTAPVVGNGMTLGLRNSTLTGGLGGNTGSGVLSAYIDYYGDSYGTTGASDDSVTGSLGVTTDPTKSGLVADISQASAVTVTMLRAAFAAQLWMERNMRAGVRYIEFILSHFGVRSSDARLQRAEFLGGSRTPLLISEVLQTSSTDATSPQGNMAGHGISARRTHGFTKSFEEYGLVMGLYCVMPRTGYQQGLARQWNKNTAFDWYMPEFAHLSEQAILESEIYAQADDASTEVNGVEITNNTVFGYTPIYDEYRKRYSVVHGQFKDTLDYWTMQRIFDGPPVLNDEFVVADPTERVNVVTGEDNLLVDVWHDVTAIRPIPKHGYPGLTDHS